MTQRIGWIVIGFLLAIVLLVAGGYLFIMAGGVPMATSARPLPLEATVAGLAIRASVHDSINVKDPLPVNEANLLGGVDVYRDHCAMCHGTPDRPKPAIADGMFPVPPQMVTDQMVTDQPEGEIYWIVTNGIRLSGMPGFAKTLSDTQRWQVTMLLTRADALPANVQTALAKTP